MRGMVLTNRLVFAVNLTFSFSLYWLLSLNKRSVLYPCTLCERYAKYDSYGALKNETQHALHPSTSPTKLLQLMMLMMMMLNKLKCSSINYRQKKTFITAKIIKKTEYSSSPIFFGFYFALPNLLKDRKMVKYLKIYQEFAQSLWEQPQVFSNAPPFLN